MYRILSIATAWGSRYGGVNVFNYRLCCALAGLSQKVTCYVKEAQPQDVVDARDKSVDLKFLGNDSQGRWSREDVGFIDYANLGELDVVIVHDIIAKVFVDQAPPSWGNPIVVAFIHTLYEYTDYFGKTSDDARLAKVAEQVELLKASDIVCTSGGFIAQHLKHRYPELSEKIHSFIPGRLNLRPMGPSDTGAITSFGRLSISDEKKQASNILEAYRGLCSASIRDQQFAADIPKLRLVGAQVDLKIQQEIKQNGFQESGWKSRPEFLNFEHYYEFESSNTLKLITDSKIIITASVVESFGLTSLEAACLGIPLIAGRMSGFACDLKQLIRPVPETAIEWLDVSDFDDLPVHLCRLLSRMLEHYPSRKNGAMVLAQEIEAKWPTWEDSSNKFLTEIARFKLAQPLGQPSKDAQVKVVSSPFAKLADRSNVNNRDDSPSPRALPSPVEDVSFERNNDLLPASSESSLEKLARSIYGNNLTLGGILDQMVTTRYSGKRCTSLQQQIANSLAVEALHKYRDILLCGGTSSGKTTLAELLFGVANDSDFSAARIIYLAPTRALAQERYRDWCNAFNDFVIPRCQENVIISTGEDHSSDRSLARGEFLIACLVFEKANVILSTSAELVKRLTMIVVDELHMVSDIHRGPIIETLLAKLKYEKRRRQKRDDVQLPMRIIGITTERTTAEGFGRYFTNLDRNTDKDIHPLVAQDTGRPSVVHHILIEPENSGERPYREIPIATFSRSSSLYLSQEQLAAFSSRLPVYARNEESSNYSGGRGKKIKHENKHVAFLRDWLFNNSYGKRLLAFIGSKSEQVNLADRVQSEIKKSYTLNERLYNVESLEPLFEQIKNDDTSISLDILNRAISRGIFIHNADINRSLRFAMEDYLSKPLPSGAASEVIIATETLSYGVNLSIDDVALFSLEFPSSERNQEFGATPRLLSRCAFANMCGRAGRLNQKASEATVYVWSVTDNDATPRRIVENFYCDEESVRSQIFHGEDKEAFERLAKGGRDSEAPLRFTYPFVRTILDGLRFTGGAPGLIGATRRNDAFIQELEDEFSDHLLYTQENIGNQRNLERLRESIILVIEGSIQSNLELVKRSGRGYKITQLGSSIIDTGTEISTLEPLKNAVDTLLKLLLETVSIDNIPIEILLLSIVVQNEAHRQIITGMPEFRIDDVREDNRGAMIKWIGDSFADRGFSPIVLEVIDSFLAYCDTHPRHAPSGDISTHAVHDACLRSFCGLLLWVSGESIANIHTKLKSIGVIIGRPPQINTNFATFADRMSWKLLFLVDLMRYTNAYSDARILQTKASRLNYRLRLGCAEHALPLLVRDGTRPSVITRKAAHELIRQGATLKTISSGEFDLDQFSSKLRSQIRAQVRSYVRSSFLQLKSEFIYGSSALGNDAIARNYWSFADTVIRRATENNEEMPPWLGNNPDECYPAQHAVHGLLESDSPSVFLREGNGDLLLIGQKLHWEDDTSTLVEALKWHVQASYGNNVLHQPLADYNSVIIDFPWLLNAQPGDSSVLRMSPAAFGILLTLISRSFLKDSVAALELLSLTGGSISSLSLMDMLYSELNISQFPEALFDSWAGYWDAE